MSQSSNQIQETINTLFNLAYPESYKLPNEVQLYLFYPNNFDIRSLLSIYDLVLKIKSALAYWTVLFAVYLPNEKIDVSLGLSNTTKIKKMKELHPGYFEIVLEAFEPTLLKYITNTEDRFLFDWLDILKDLIVYPALINVFNWLKLRLKEKLIGLINVFLESRSPENVLVFLEKFSQAHSVFTDMIKIFTSASLYILDIVQSFVNSSDDHRLCLKIMQIVAKFKFMLSKRSLKLFKKIESILGKFDDEKMIDVQVNLIPLYPGASIDGVVLENRPIFQKIGSQFNVRVFRGTDRNHISVIAKEYSGFDDCDYSYINEEIRILTTLNQFTSSFKIFIKLYYVLNNPGQVVFYMEDGGQNLMDLMSTHKISGSYLDSRLIEYWIYELIDGFTWLETCKIFHRNIKPHNMLVDRQNSIKVVDFSTSLQNEYQESSFIPTELSPIQGTEGYMAPELREAYSKGSKNSYFKFGKADVFSLGLTVLQMITLDKLEGLNFTHNSPKLIDKVNKCHAVSWVKQLLTKMLEVDRKKRPNFRQCMEILPGRTSTIVN